MQARYHILVSGTAAAGLYAATGSLGTAGALALTGVLVDVDHVIDYLALGRGFSVRDFLRTCDSYRLRTMYFVFHSAELFGLLCIAALLLRGGLLTGAAIGLGLHLGLDYLFNPARPLSYSLLYRWHKGFIFDQCVTVPQEFRGNNDGNDPRA